MTTTWKLAGKPAGGGSCEHLRAVTGWTLTAAQAERELRMIGIRARRAANWAAFAETSPKTAATILAGCAAYAAKFNIAHLGSGASHEVKLGIEEGHAWMADRYMADRTRLVWVRS